MEMEAMVMKTIIVSTTTAKTAKNYLSQLQWIEHIYNNRQLANKLLECLDICPIESQRDIAKYLILLMMTSKNLLLKNYLKLWKMK